MKRKISNKSVKKTEHPAAVDFTEQLIKRLKDHDFAVEYLNAAIAESENGDEEAREILLVALRNVAAAQGNMSAIAKRTHLRRETLYRILSKNGNPTIDSFISLMHAMGFSLRIC